MPWIEQNYSKFVVGHDVDIPGPPLDTIASMVYVNGLDASELGSIRFSLKFDDQGEEPERFFVYSSSGKMFYSPVEADTLVDDGK